MSIYCDSCSKNKRWNIKHPNIPTKFIINNPNIPDKIDLFIIGDSPSNYEDQTGSYLSDPLGKSIEKFLNQYGNSINIGITNIIRCYDTSFTPKNITACKQYLLEEINKYKPSVIVITGNIGIKELLGIQNNIMDIYSGILWFNNIPVITSLSLSYCKKYPAGKHILIQDLLFAIKIAKKEINISIFNPNYSNKYKYITEDNKKEIFTLLLSTKYIAIDFETYGLNIFSNSFKILCCSLCINQEVFIIDLQQNNKLLIEFIQLINTTNIYLIVHNVYFEGHILNRYYGLNMFMRDRFIDTMLIYPLINQHTKLNLDAISYSVGMLNFKAESEIELDKIKGSKKTKFIYLPDNILHNRCAMDAIATYRVFKKVQYQAKIIKELYNVDISYLINTIIIPLISALLFMTYRGVQINFETVKEIKNNLMNQENIIIDKIYQNKDISNYIQQKGELNFNSTKQLQDFYFKFLNLSCNIRTKTGDYSVSSETLKDLEFLHETIPLILQLRKIRKLISTYLILSSSENIIHTTYKFTNTLRLRSAEPNLQNIPSHGNGKIIKSIYEARPGYYYVEADYSQVELRVAASIMNDPIMKDIYKKNGDIHKSTASIILNIPENQIQTEDRYKAKSANFGLLYGQTPEGFRKYAKSNYNLILSSNEAELFHTRFFNTYIGVKEYNNKTRNKLQRQGIAPILYENILVYIRYLHSIGSENKNHEGLNSGINTTIQGSASLFTLKSIAIFFKLYRTKKILFYPLLTIHDSIIFEVPESCKIEIVKMQIKYIMESYKLKNEVQLKVDFKSGKTWGDLKDC